MTLWIVYIIECADGSWYCGSTTDLNRRLQEHQNGKGCAYTRSRLPVKFVACSDLLNDRSAAQKLEFKVKRGSKHKQKLAALRETWQGDPQ